MSSIAQAFAVTMCSSRTTRSASGAASNSWSAPPCAINGCCSSSMTEVASAHIRGSWIRRFGLVLGIQPEHDVLNVPVAVRADLGKPDLRHDPFGRFVVRRNICEQRPRRFHLEEGSDRLRGVAPAPMVTAEPVADLALAVAVPTPDRADELPVGFDRVYEA